VSRALDGTAYSKKVSNGKQASHVTAGCRPTKTDILARGGRRSREAAFLFSVSKVAHAELGDICLSRFSGGCI
jgi:hypothetical protein